VPVPLPTNAGAVKATVALAFPVVAVPIVGVPGLRPSWESVIPIFSIFELYHTINRFFLVLRKLIYIPPSR
jgi:hypothetical protein